MEPVCYTVQTINGDYAYLLSDSGVENQVAMFLLPEGTDPHMALDKLRALEEEDPNKAKAALVTQLAVRAQRDLLLAERVLDTLRPPEEEKPGKDKKKKGKT